MNTNGHPNAPPAAEQLLPWQGERHRTAVRSLLGSMLRDAESIGDVLQVAQPCHVLRDPERSVFAACVRLYDRGSGVDMVTVAEELHRAGHAGTSAAELAPLLAEMWDSVPHAAHALHYARIVRDHAILFALHAAALGMVRDAADPPRAADELLDDAERAVFAIAEQGTLGRAVPLADALHEAAAAYDARAAAVQTGLPSAAVRTGFEALDALLAGGLADGALTVLAARPSLGKTALGACIAINAARRGDGVLFVSLEQSRLELADRFLAGAASVNSFDIRAGTLGHVEQGKIMDAHDALRPAKMWIDDSPGQTMLRIGAAARRMKHRSGVRLLVIDYLGLIEGEDRRASRQEQVAGISRRLKALARELGIPVLCLAQLNREVEHRSGDARPKLADLRDSGAVEQDADVVILLYRAADQAALPEPRVEAIVAKHRNGATGTVRLLFRKSYVRFDEAEAAPDFHYHGDS